MAISTYNRRVHFYHVVLYAKDGNIFQDEQANKDIFSEACNKIQILNAKEKTSKLIKDNESYRLIYFKKNGDHYDGKVAKYRSNHILTGNISDDKLSDLSLEDGKEFVEVTHFVYYPKKHVLSFEYNQIGPRVTAFIRYINKIHNMHNVDQELFIPELIPHPSVIERLKDVKRIKKFIIGISADRIPDTTNQSTLFRGMEYIRGFSNAGMITVQLSAGTSQQGESIIDPTQLIHNLESEVDLAVLGKASIEAVTDFGDEMINLIDNKMVGVKVWNGPITTENFNRWFEDIQVMYQERSELIDQSLRKNEKSTQ